MLTVPSTILLSGAGPRNGIRPNMGVVGPSGIVGVVRSVNDNYAVVFSTTLSKGEKLRFQRPFEL